MQKNVALDFKVGVFVLIGIVILVALILFIGDFRILKPGYNFDIMFSFTNGLQKSSPVRLAGVEVGQVEEVKIVIDKQNNDLKVRVRVWVEEDAEIPLDSKIEINTLGVLGQKYIEIIPGNDFSVITGDGDVLPGTDPVPMFEIANMGRRIALKFEDSVNKARKILGDEDIRVDLKESLQDLRMMIKEVKNGKGTLGKLIYERKIYDDLEELVLDIKANPWKLFKQETP